jgi:hypothetical protein
MGGERINGEGEGEEIRPIYIIYKYENRIMKLVEIF